VRVCALLILILLAGEVEAREPIPVAVSSNFVPTFTEIAMAFEEKTGIHAMARAGSTGQLYAQIFNGAPYDIFVAADAQRPEALVQSGYGVAGMRFTYALGRLVVWSNVADDCLAVLHDASAGRIALANPELAPYGVAAREFLQAIGAWHPERNVLGANAMQARSFAVTGNVVAAIIPQAQLTGMLLDSTSCVYEVPQSSHSPIEQQAVLLDASNDDARRFLEFLRSDEARQIIEQDGYEVRR
jgi:molybdate transport system substrate-binding protein